MAAMSRRHSSTELSLLFHSSPVDWIGGSYQLDFGTEANSDDRAHQ